MIIVTSLSANHSNKANQQAAIDSWQQYGKCYSMNGFNENIEGFTGIEFIKTDLTMGHLYGKPLVNIHSVFHFAKEKRTDLLMTNSDIIFRDLPEFKQDGVTILSRHDYDHDINASKKFENGFDVFYIPAKFLHIFPLSIYALGACWHDYSTPMVAINNNIPVYSFRGKHTFHKLHPVQYPVKEYYDIGEFFKWEFKLNRKLQVPQIASQTLALINSKIIYLDS